MKRLVLLLAVVAGTIPLATGLLATPKPTTSLEDGLPKGIAFYGVLSDGLREAKATNRPILFLSAAPQCASVPGMW